MKTLLAIVAWLISFALAPAISAQAHAPEEPRLHQRCTTLAATSDNPALPTELFVTYLQARGDFQASKLQITNDLSASDAVIRLTADADSETGIIVANHGDGRRVKPVSNWTNYPGMVALEAIENLKTVCPDSVVELAARPALTNCPAPS
jgi:hypothetical protein